MLQSCAAPSARQAALTSLLHSSAIPQEAALEAPDIVPARLAQRIHQLLNQTRQQQGLQELGWSRQLERVAASHCIDMARGQYFSHIDLMGNGPAERAAAAGIQAAIQRGNYLLTGVGENIFLSHRYHKYSQDAVLAIVDIAWKDETALSQEAIAAWLASPSHRENMLSPLYDRAAVGVFVASNHAIYVTMNFLMPASGSQLTSR